ncbi:MAG: hypothetical protein ACLT98_10175 [Eggerthellaceae bacterium]
MARRCALQVLYQSELLDKPADIVVEEGLVPEDAGMGDYARMLISALLYSAELDRTSACVHEIGRSTACPWLTAACCVLPCSS